MTGVVNSRYSLHQQLLYFGLAIASWKKIHLLDLLSAKTKLTIFCGELVIPFGVRSISEVQLFWKDMMAHYGTAKKYQEELVSKFKDEDGEDAPELLIVVDKLLTGFDAPRNAVLYLVDTPRSKETEILLSSIQLAPAGLHQPG
jgi:hypothetical protein